MVVIQAVSYLKDVVGFDEKSFIIDEPTKIRDLVSISKIPDERVIVLINERGGKLDNKVFADDKVVLLPVVGGG